MPLPEPERIEGTADLGAAVRARRKELGLTLTDAAERMGVGRRLLLELEHGDRNVGLETVLRIVQLLGLDLYVGDRRSTT
jgi:HTH-type transcriptional regulator/antitoxin HipB